MRTWKQQKKALHYLDNNNFKRSRMNLKGKSAEHRSRISLYRFVVAYAQRMKDKEVEKAVQSITNNPRNPNNGLCLENLALECKRPNKRKENKPQRFWQTWENLKDSITERLN